MKRYLSSLFACGLCASGIGVFGSQATAAIADYQGAYEALLISGEGLSALPAAKLELKVTAKGTFTGKLIADGPKDYSIKGSLAEVDGVAVLVPAKGSDERLLRISRGKNVPGYELAFTLAGGALQAELSSGSFSASATDGVALKPVAKGEPAADWAGAYTVAFSSPEKTPGASANTFPSGSGYASATVDAKGVFKYAGKLADGTKLTGLLQPTRDRSYRLFVNPYKTKDSFFGGHVQLESIGGGAGFHAAEDTELFWRKSAASKPNAYTGGFGPLGVATRVEPWVKPGKGQNLTGLLGANGKQISFSLTGAGLDAEGAYLGQLPAKIEINAKNELVPVFGDAFAPATAAEWAKLWKVKVNPATGVYTGTLQIRDLIQSPSTGSGSGAKYTPVKFVKRKIMIEGVLVRDAGNVLEPFIAAGFFLLPPVNAKTGVILAGDAEASGPLETRGVGGPVVGAVSPGTPGTYTFTARQVLHSVEIPDGLGVTVSGSMKNLPAAGSVVTFTIAPDLSSITVNGRKVPLVSDSRPVALVFSDASEKNVKNSLTVTVYTNTTTGFVTGIATTYIQLLSAKINVFGQSRSAYYPGVATYDSPVSPLKIK